MSDWLDHVTAATTETDGPAGNGNIPTTFPGITSIDGVTLNTGDPILLKNQGNKSENGIYRYHGSGTPLVFRGDALGPQAVVRVAQGTVNGKTEWSLKDTTNNFWTKAWASTADAIYYVSSSLVYADDAFDGLSHGTAHKTIAHALATLGTRPGVIQLLSAESGFNAPVGGLTLATRQGLIGVGATASKVLGASGAAGDAVVTLSGSRSSIENMWVRVSAESGVGVRVTCTGTNENSRLTNIFCENQTQNAIAFGIGDNTGLDVSEVVMIGCDSVGNSAMGSIHMYVGDGETANVGDITNIGGNSQENKYGVVMAGGWLVSRGLNFQGSGTADIWLKQPGVGNISFDGGRSEGAARFVVSNFGVVTYATVKVANYTVVGLQNTDGQGVQFLGRATATFDNVAMFGAHAPQYFALRGVADNDFPAILTARDCASEHPFPFQTNWSRPGKIIRSSGTRFTGDAGFQLWSRNTTSDTWVRRKNVTNTAVFTINPFFYDAIDINLAGSGTGSGVNTPVIIPGAVGQTVTICFQQDGVGGWAFTWPVLCAWSGGSAPANVTTPRNRQSCTFRYNGHYWEQIGPVTNVLPPAAAATPITDNFGTQVPGGNPFWLNQPDTRPLPAPMTPRWEHVPGGGSLGIKQVGGVNVCVTPCLGYFGDNESDDGNGLFGPGAAAVIETGMATQSTGISATLTWQNNEGIVCHYRDDQNFVVFTVSATRIHARGWSHGQLSNLGDLIHGLTMVAGSRHTLLVKCTATSFSVSFDGAAPHSYTLSAADQSNLLDFTKHGILSSHLSATFTNFTVS